ncbi:MAG: caspase domain-containing protein [Rhodocyclales bacterium]|nr:caspase domain-containing protein [Rhodocyclales bacterium]
MSILTPSQRCSRWNKWIICLAAMLLGGCVKIYIVGHTDDWSDYMTGSGSAAPLGGEGSAEIRFVKLGTACRGTFRDYALGKARGEIRCDDARVIKTESWAVSLSAGKGYGTDQLGHRGEFEFFTDIDDYERELASVRAEVERRKLDVVHLRAPRQMPSMIEAPAAAEKAATVSPSPVAMPATPTTSAVVPAIAPALAPAIAPGGAGKRLALVIGNGSYREAPLKNPVSDARALSTKLRALGFEVMSGENLGQREMTRLVARFGERLAGHDVGMFFFAGHGIQVKGKNYLIPVDAQISSENSVRAEAVDVDAVLDQLSASPLNLVILDACRNNPFERRFRSLGGGLAQMEAPKGTLIAYATAPGKVAQDGDGANSTYTTALLKVLAEPGLPVESVFKRVRSEVSRMTGDTQIPWEASSLTGDFFFVSASAGSPPKSAPTAGADSEAELLFWQSVKDSPDASDFEAYLRQYPNGRFSEIARNRLNRMKSAK